jgi:zinc D-Ala-D-Ala dipeptidase
MANLPFRLIPPIYLAAMAFVLLSSFVHAQDKADAPSSCPGEPLVDVAALIPDAVIDMKYAGEDNFLKRKFYPVNRCLLRESAAKKLQEAAKQLKGKQRRLVLWDCYRPASVQRELWKAHPVPGEVAHPRVGSAHSRAAAVDVALADETGALVEMPTRHDDFTPKAHREAKGIPKEALVNRELLKQAMAKAGFQGIRREWWHYETKDSKRFPLCDAEIKQ